MLVTPRTSGMSTTTVTTTTTTLTTRMAFARDSHISSSHSFKGEGIPYGMF